MSLHTNAFPSKKVQFDVGGTLYKVSRSLLEQHPNTMLCKMASDTWNNNNVNNDDGALFVEADGERFRFILDYMRRGSIVLPVSNNSISRAALMADLDYFGFDNVPSDAIQYESDATKLVEQLQRLKEEGEAKLEEHQKAIDSHTEEGVQLKARQEIERLELQQRHAGETGEHEARAKALDYEAHCIRFANYAFEKYKSTGSLVFYEVYRGTKKSADFDLLDRIASAFNETVLNKRLGLFGFQYENMYYASFQSVQIWLKKV